MRLKTFLIFISVITVGIFNSLPSKALEPTDSTSEKYLIEHGHSKEIIRMINLQKERTEGNAVSKPSKSDGKFKRFLKNLWFEQDFTASLTDFGYNEVKSVETNNSAIPPTIEKIKSKCTRDKKKHGDSKELNINDVKIRETDQ